MVKAALHVEEINSESEWAAIRHSWDALLQTMEANLPFLTYDGFSNSFQNFNGEKQLHILAVREGSTLVGVAPLWQFQERRYFVMVKKLGFITCPDMPFVDFLIQPNKRREVLSTLLDHLQGSRPKAWDVLSLEQWPGDSPNFQLFRELLFERHKHFFIGQTSQTPYIQITGEWEAFLQTRSVRFRKSHRNIVNKVNRQHKVEPHCFVKESEGTVYDTVLDVTTRGWKHRAGLAISSREDFRGFFKQLTDIASQKGWLMVWLLTFDGKAVAVEYDLVWDKKVYALRADFDDAYRSYSPGTYLEYHIIRNLFENGYIEYSTGPGMNEYKLHWTDQVRDNMALDLYNGTVSGWALWRFEQLRFFLKRMREHYYKRFD